MPLNSRKSCPSEEELLRSTSGDLSTRRARRVDAHLRACQSCRARIEQWERTLDLYRQSTRPASGDLGRRDAFPRALDAEMAAWRRTRSAMRRRWVSAAAMVAALVAAIAWYRTAEVTLDAEEILSRAIEYEAHQPRESPSFVRIRQIAVDTHFPLQPLTARDRTARELARRLAEHGFSWDAPLSARPFQRWRDATPEREDRLSRMNLDLIKVSTDTDRGPVRQAEIIVRTSTYEPVAQTWHFADGLRLELTSLPESRPPEIVSAPTAPTPLAAPAAAATPPVAAAPMPKAPLELDALELDLRTALLDAGAPVGRDLALSKAGHGLRIGGTIASPEIAQRIDAYLHTHAQLSVDAWLQPRDASVSGVGEPLSANVQAWLDRTIADPDERSNFISRTWMLRDDVEIGVFALTNLARRYPPPATAALSPSSRQKLNALALAQLRDLSKGYDALRQHLAILVGDAPRPQTANALPDDWHERATSLRAPLDDLTHSLRVVFSTPEFAATADFRERAQDLLRPALHEFATAIAGH